VSCAGSDFFVRPFHFPLKEWIRLKVYAKGGNLAFYVNDSLFGTVQDDTYLSGGIGFGVAGAHAEFDDVVVRRLE
jgi:hypothetical protein